MTDFQILVEKIAKAIAVAKYPYDGNGDIVVGKKEEMSLDSLYKEPTFVSRDVKMSVDEFWNKQTEEYKNEKKIEAQAALDVMSVIGMQEVMYQSLKSYLDEK